MSPDFSKGDRVWVCRQPKNLGDKTCPYWMGPTRLWPRRHMSSMLYQWTNGG